jgi:branched-chain amino acid transport system substrate-binding protein
MPAIDLGQKYMEVKGMFKKPLVLGSLAVLLLVAMVVAACGGDNNDENTASGTRPTPVPGPGVGETAGVTDTTIKIGALLPLSNTTAAAWGVPIKAGMEAFVDYINDQGGIYGRKLEMDVGDSQYTGPVATEVIRKLVEQDGIFLLQGSLGTEAHQAVYQYLQEKGIPDMYVLTGDSLWTDPVSYNRFGYLVDYTDEGRILGQYIGKNFDGKKVGILAQNDGFGKEGEKGIKLGIEDAGAKVTYATTQYYDATQTDVSAQMGRLKSDGVDVVGFYGMPAQAAGGITYARTTLSWDVPFVITGVDAVEIVGALTGYPNIEGTVSVVYGHQAYDLSWPGMQEFADILKKYKPDQALDNLSLTGMAVTEMTVEGLRLAGKDLTRSSFLTTEESLCGHEFRASFKGSGASTSATDHRPIEAEIYVKATGTTKETFHWAEFGDVMNFETTKDCKAPTLPADYDKQPK